MIGTASSADGEFGARSLGWAVPLVPIAISGFLLSATTYHRLMGGVGGEGLLSGVVVGFYDLFGFEPFFMFNLLVLTWSSIWFLTGQIERPAARLLKVFGLTVCLALLVNLRPDGSLVQSGGDLGGFLATRLQGALGYGPSTILVVLASLAALLLATDYFFYRHFDGLGRGPDGKIDVAVEPAAVEALKGPIGPASAVEPRGPVVIRTTRTPLDTEISAEDLAFAVSAGESAVPEDPADGLGTAVLDAPDGDSPSYESYDDDEIVFAEEDAELVEDDAGGVDEDDDEESEIDEYEEEEEEEDEYEEDSDEEDEDEEEDEEEDEYEGDEADEEEDAELAWDQADLEEEDEDEDDEDEAEDTYDAVGRVDVELAVDVTVPEEAPAEPSELADGAAAEPERAVVVPQPEASGRQGALFGAPSDDDELLQQAVGLVVEFRRASANFLRRRLRISNDEALDVLAALAERGVIEYEAGASQGRVIVDA